MARDSKSKRPRINVWTVSFLCLLAFALTSVVWHQTANVGGPGGSVGDQSTPPAASERPIQRLRIGTFNIRMFPCNQNCDCKKRYNYGGCRSTGAARTDLRRLAHTIRSIDPDILAVNEILDPKRLARFARERLGSSWRFACAAQGDPLKVGFLYNSSVVTLSGQKVFTELFTKLVPREHPRGCVPTRRDLRPAFACRFEVKDTLFDFYAVVIHLKAGACSSVRRAQWRIMEGIVHELAAGDDDILVLGDFNDYRRGRKDSDDFCRITGFTLVSGSIPCSKLFKAKGGTLDNILVSPAALARCVRNSARVGGACAKSCRMNKFWKAYLNRVSDHCPVVAELRINNQ